MKMNAPMPCTVPVHSEFLLWPKSNRCDVTGSGSKAKASVVVMLHLCPGCDPELFPWLLRPKSQVELMPLSPANSYPLVLRHYPVVDGSLEESMLVGDK